MAAGRAGGVPNTDGEEGEAKRGGGGVLPRQPAGGGDERVHYGARRP